LKTKPTYILGDHHSDYDDLIRALLRRGLRGCRIIHVGDGEEGYPDVWDDHTVERLDSAFASLEIEYLSIRGNHANPHVFDGSVHQPNFQLLADYTRQEIDGQTWLFVGGAVSVNRLDREPGKTWWMGEEMILDETRAQPADVLVTHTGPSWLTPPGNAMVDYYAAAETSIGTTTLRRELRDEAARHDRLFEFVRPRQWYFGHHHHSATHHHDGCTIRQLGLAELVRHHPANPT
jgi:hypothetical protein